MAHFPHCQRLAVGVAKINSQLQLIDKNRFKKYFAMEFIFGGFGGMVAISRARGSCKRCPGTGSG
jgi:hypothetical protein